MIILYYLFILSVIIYQRYYRRGKVESFLSLYLWNLRKLRETNPKYVFYPNCSTVIGVIKFECFSFNKADSSVRTLLTLQYITTFSSLVNVLITCFFYVHIANKNPKNNHRENTHHSLTRIVEFKTHIIICE